MTNSQFLYAYISRSQSHLHLKPQQHHAIHQKTPCLCPIFKLQKCTKNNLPSNSCRNIVLLQYVFVWGCIYIFNNGSLFLRDGMCSTQTQTTKSKSSILCPFHKLCVIFTQFTLNTQIDFDTHFDKTFIFPSKTKLSDNLKI